MSAKILNGSELAKSIKENIKKEVEELKKQGIFPGLAVIIVGNDPASRLYVDFKKKDCAEVGIESFEFALDEKTTEEELIKLIQQLNIDSKISAILVQLPLPAHLNEERVINAINPDKDADCFHPFNVGRLMTGNPLFLPCTPAGIIELLEANEIEIAGKECVVVGRSNIVGKPLAILLLSKNGTVTVCHSKTKNLDEVCRRADILVVAAGKPELIKGNAIKPGAVVIDVGVNRLEGKKLVGDVEFSTASEVASAITRVTGGVGPMTRAMLLKNTVKAAEILDIKNKKAYN
ncbi:MAG TPA: bifunctional methylenetetrahydrofolate dehydrogenase/methenyltetrahydrofolate cyclohydrolase FolD [Clostridiaceae bacterium]|nr:bifunctional methylenetetrahydrofolate dehydrogenase/methenyltetrahydrofolate cyclohydrolase FolD [Clostridiaceae bacterium]